MARSNEVSQSLCPRCLMEPGVAGGPCRACQPYPMVPRCAWCGEKWPKAGQVCGPKCAAALAADFAVSRGATDPEREEAIDHAITRAVEHEREANRWRFIVED